MSNCGVETNTLIASERLIEGMKVESQWERMKVESQWEKM